MSHPDTTSKDAVFQWRGIPQPGQLLPLGLQHVVAAVVGVITPAILIADTCGLSSADKTLMIQVSLILTALATLLQLFPIFHRIGSGLPVIMGISFAYIPTLQAIGGEFGLPTILGAEIVGGIVAIVFGVLVKWIRPLFPPLVTGTVIFTIGLSLYPTAVKYMAGGAGSEWFGSAKSWAVALITLAVVVFLNHFTKGITKLASILIGILAGYVIAYFLGIVDLSGAPCPGPCPLTSSSSLPPVCPWASSTWSMRYRPSATSPPPPWAAWTACPPTRSSPAALWARAS